MRYLKALLLWLLLPAGPAAAQPTQPAPPGPAVTVEASRVYSLVRFLDKQGHFDPEHLVVPLQAGHK